jgi:hypothetical protein
MFATSRWRGGVSLQNGQNYTWHYFRRADN